MAAAFAAHHLSANHPDASILLFGNQLFPDWLNKTRPTRAGVILGIGIEELLPAAGASKHALILETVVLSGKGNLGTLFPEYLKPIAAEFLLPLLVAQIHLFIIGCSHYVLPGFVSLSGPDRGDFELSRQNRYKSSQKPANSSKLGGLILRKGPLSISIPPGPG